MTDALSGLPIPSMEATERERIAMKLGLVGIGAIARKQHQPAIEDNPDLTLVATASRNGTLEGVTSYTSLADMLAAERLDAVVLCVPPAPRFEMAREALAAGCHVFLEKPPGLTVAEVEILRQDAMRAGVSLLASWHSRYAPGVAPFAERLRATTLRRVSVTWQEDVRFFHPGQAWIWQPGGFGVFDPGINALSILTHALPRAFRLTASKLFVPSNCAQPIRAELAFRDSANVPIDCLFDFDQPDDPTWRIEAETDAGTYRLEKGGAQLFLDGNSLIDEPEREYPALYAHFVDLVKCGASDVDVTPLAHVADAFMAAETEMVGPFDENVPAKTARIA